MPPQAPPLMTAAVNGSQVMSTELSCAYYTVGSLGPQTHPVVVSLLLKCKIRMNLFGERQNLHISLLTCGRRATRVGKAQ